ncbi:hypothetical protein ATCC90586_007235 [Pythium insidiosum]|nr:hypothetical protein ATCC90586_007235 [Pythium insidiosum]
MVAQHRSRVSTTDDNEATAIQLAEFTAEDSNNLVTVDESHRGHSAVISITTALMRATYARFPELVLVDCTHQTNRYNYHLCSFMVIDECGEVKYFSVAVKKPELGSISPEDRQAVENLLKNLVYASSAEAYAQEHCSLKLLCERVHFTEFFEYFERNWDSCQAMWVQYHRAKLPYFRVNTNNHLESYFGKLKECVTPDMSMSECLKELIARERTRQNDYKYLNNRVGTYVNRNYDDEMSVVLRFTTHFVADNVAKEYDIGRSKASAYSYVETNDVIKVQGIKNTNEVDRLTWARLSVPVPRVRQFTFNAFNARQRDGSHRSPRERYHEAMRQLQPLCSEIAEISDDEEFKKALKFVQDAWMNARMRKRVKLDVGLSADVPEEASDAEPPTQLSAVTMQQLVESLDEEKPGLVELKRRLDAICVRHLEKERSKVELSEMRSTFKATRVLSLDNPDKKRTRSSPVSPYKFSPEIEAEIQAFYSDDSVQVIGIPVGFNNRHWCCLYINKAHRLISTYDSLGGAKTQRVMSILAEKIDTFVPEKLFTVQRVQTPVQSEAAAFSCATSFGAK